MKQAGCTIQGHQIRVLARATYSIEFMGYAIEAEETGSHDAGHCVWVRGTKLQM